MKPKQIDLIPKKRFRLGSKADLVDSKQIFGGALQYRKMKRPFQKNKSTHLILRSRLLAGSRSLMKANRSKWVEILLNKKAQKYGARLYRFSINSNHLHLLIRFESAKAQRQFL